MNKALGQHTGTYEKIQSEPVSDFKITSGTEMHFQTPGIMVMRQDALTSKIYMLEELHQSYTVPSVIFGASLLKFKDKKALL